ncbi:YkgJ family cysteine cluster protein (plasmid) [Azospirillum sp. HJ39]|uniref:YkgJ family cysteine cluster protein n=1 Tax=Azospirillum sp. HJ39 TaxID=3159496 RepID=UPI0035573564
MSPCDACSKPGKCCRSFVLNFPSQPTMTPLEALSIMAAHWLPFMPLMRYQNGVFRFWCPLLGTDGRCTDYESRPDTCRVFRPASDPLCVMWEALPQIDVGIPKEAAA